jgi:ABC-type proline/glycine betaine transport system ATPase subunit
MARDCAYSIAHIKDIGSQLWQALSKALGERVTKKNLFLVLQQYLLSRTGEDEKRMREIRLMKVPMVFQRFGLFPHKTVAENVEYGLLVRGVDKASRRQKALKALELVDLAQWADYLPDSLSGEMQQRVGLARALATEAEILLIDEPLSALNPLIRQEMQNKLLRLRKELHKTINPNSGLSKFERFAL